MEKKSVGKPYKHSGSMGRKNVRNVVKRIDTAIINMGLKKKTECRLMHGFYNENSVILAKEVK